MSTLLTDVEQWLLAAAQSPWALLVLVLGCYLDALFPPVPSETIVLALGTLAVSGHGPHPALVLLLAASGAFLGDRTAYAIGARMPSRCLPFVRRDRAERLLARVRDRLDQRGAAFILSARYVPVGRVAVNVGAGMVGFPARRFTGYAAVSSVLWATWTVLLGVCAGALLQGRPLVSVVVGVVSGLLVGLGIDALLRWRARRSGPSLEEDVSFEDRPHARVPFAG